jgi:hypothetical protein
VQAAFLALDRDGNGFIDDGRELFGTATPLELGGNAPNGFAALAELDEDSDGRIDAFDSGFGDLKLWTDTNHNGLSEATELLPLTATAVTAIFLEYELTGRRDRHGNRFWLKGSALMKKRGVDRRVNVLDALLAT